MIRTFPFYMLLTLLTCACSHNALRHESIENNTIRVFVIYDLSLLSKEEMDDDLIEKKLHTLATIRAEELLQAKAFSLGITQLSCEAYLASIKESLQTKKIYDSQTGDTITAGFDIYFPGLLNFLTEQAPASADNDNAADTTVHSIPLQAEDKGSTD